MPPDSYNTPPVGVSPQEWADLKYRLSDEDIENMIRACGEWGTLFRNDEESKTKKIRKPRKKKTKYIWPGYGGD